MAKQRNAWQTLSLHPLAGLLDTRSRPADIPQGAYRYKLNFAISGDGKLCTRDGFDRFHADTLFSGVYPNFDWHHVGATRNPITTKFESTASDGTRRLFGGRQDRIALLNESTGYWTDLATGKGAAGAYWNVAELQDVVLFTNNVDPVLAYDINAHTTTEVTDLKNSVGVTAARVILEFKGVVVLMNVFQSGKRFSSRVRWSDLNLPLSWAVGAPGSVANFQDLDYGDEILAAAELLGSIYIYTRRAIWRMSLASISTDPAAPIFTFTKVYVEKKNQYRCLTFPRTLVSTGDDHWYLSRDAIHHYNPYLTSPERPDQLVTDWLYRASGVIYRKMDTAMTGLLCNAPVMEFRPATRELWVSWPSGTNTLNNWTLVSQIDYKTSDVVDEGFTAFCNFRRTPTADLCNEVQDFLASSSRDFSIKSVGGVFFREFVQLDASGDVTKDLPLNAPDAVYTQEGYARQLRGIVPTGLYDRPKEIRSVLLDDDTTDQDTPCVVRCRIGVSRNLRDANDMDPKCAPLWIDFGRKVLGCQDEDTAANLAAKNQQPSGTTNWPMSAEAYFMTFELTVENADGGAAIGGDSCFSRIDFDVMAKPKPNR